MEAITSKYGEQPDQSKITARGQQYLDNNFPDLDYIISARLVDPSESPAPSEDPADSQWVLYVVSILAGSTGVLALVLVIVVVFLGIWYWRRRRAPRIV